MYLFRYFFKLICDIYDDILKCSVSRSNLRFYHAWQVRNNASLVDGVRRGLGENALSPICEFSCFAAVSPFTWSFPVAHCLPWLPIPNKLPFLNSPFPWWSYCSWGYVTLVNKHIWRSSSVPGSTLGSGDREQTQREVGSDSISSRLARPVLLPSLLFYPCLSCRPFLPSSELLQQPHSTLQSLSSLQFFPYITASSMALKHHPVVHSPSVLWGTVVHKCAVQGGEALEALSEYLHGQNYFHNSPKMLSVVTEQPQAALLVPERKSVAPNYASSHCVLPCYSLRVFFNAISLTNVLDYAQDSVKLLILLNLNPWVYIFLIVRVTEWECSESTSAAPTASDREEKHVWDAWTASWATQCFHFYSKELLTISAVGKQIGTRCWGPCRPQAWVFRQQPAFLSLLHCPLLLLVIFF